ncbi:hypothetical protein PoB_000866300 [Plakobranchus ocellatus]|uniref:Uncharacterized protein n=1 Tax=Plakobranchus ocellatus TaxID=259542 RepID=A0AAV3YHZ7_9GAST|nr:hypothetical protein PoB_000866300 [Plakobranchus ocellatus]
MCTAYFIDKWPPLAEQATTSLAGLASAPCFFHVYSSVLETSTSVVFKACLETSISDIFAACLEIVIALFSKAELVLFIKLYGSNQEYVAQFNIIANQHALIFKVKCLGNSKDQQQRSAQEDKSSKNQGQVQNQSAEEIHAFDPDEDIRKILNAKSQEIQFLLASAVT